MACGRFAHRLLQMAARREAIAAADAFGKPAGGAAAAEYHALRSAMEQQQPPVSKGRAMASAAEEIRHEGFGHHDRRGGRWAMCRGRRSSPSSAFDMLESVFPNRNLRHVIDRMDRLFFDDPFFSRYAARILRQPGMGGGRARAPWDFAETEDTFRMRLDLPGLAREDVRVFVEEGDLVISAEHSVGEATGEAAAAAGAEESAHQRYSTRIMLPDNADQGTIKAELKNGVLSVTVPKVVAPEAKKNVIDVHVE